MALSDLPLGQPARADHPIARILAKLLPDQGETI